jgi:uncharacterized protein (TIGR04255 family)
MADVQLPSFRRPPVVETVLGVQFDRIPGFSNAHLGAFWKHLIAQWLGSTAEEAWTDVSDAPLIEPVFERFEPEQSWNVEKFSLRLTQDPACRLRIRNARRDAMIQVQNGRLHYNWIGQPGQDYRRYATVRPAFDRVSAAFREFLRAEKLPDIRPNQWEVTYVNHIPKGSVWTSPADWGALFVGLPGNWKEPTAVRLESFAGSWHWQIPPQRGRLHIDVKHAKINGNQPEEMLRLTLTARGPVDEAVSVGDGLDLGREVIVLTFRDITSADAHRFWELES